MGSDEYSATESEMGVNYLHIALLLVSMFVGITHDYAFKILALITNQLKVLFSSFDPDII